MPGPPKYQFVCKPFSNLKLEELYEIMALRQIVFIVEQNCPYLDADGKDYNSYHLMTLDSNGRIIAYTRLVPPGISYDQYCSIGRVVTHPDLRGTGLGKEVMKESIHQCQILYPEQSIKISAQCYLEDFYRSLGFIPKGQPYLEDDIPHIAMIR